MNLSLLNSCSDLNVTIENKLMVIQIDRIQKRNALTSEMYTAMNEALMVADTNNEVSVVLFKGVDGCFTAGNDLADFLEGDFNENSPVVVFLKTLVHFSKPVVAAISGAAVGIGTTMLMHCDLVYADQTAKFSMPFSKLGLCAEGASSLLIPMSVGYHKAAEWLLLGETFYADEALRAGVINEVVVSDVADYAKQKALKLAGLPPAGVLATRQLMKRALLNSVDDCINQEISHFSRLLDSDDAKKAFQAFLNK